MNYKDDSGFAGQLAYIEKVREANLTFFEKEGRKKKAHILTFGCQMNAHDSEKIKGMFEEMGYVLTEKEEEADFVIYNTCCVRENAENKVYGNLGFLKHRKESQPNLKIALCGCMMQQPTVIETIRKKYKFVDIVFGTFNLYKLPELIVRNEESGSPIFDIWKEHGDIVEDIPEIRKCDFKASVNIMYGCNNFCTYCIVPYVRGRERSRKPEDIIKEIEALTQKGCIEVTLLGQNVNSYGKGLEEKVSFAELLRQINDIEGLKRIRFMTSHPKDLSDELIEIMAECEKVCPHLHLPFQAGNNEILKNMNRNYTKEKYLSLIAKIKERIPHIAITTDIMVGFPGEGREEIKDTLDIIENVGFAGAFTFIYSKRTGTPAANMEQVDGAIVKENFNDVLSAVNPKILAFNQKKVGKVYEVLADDVSAQDPSFLTGRTADNSLVHFKAGKEDIGSIVNVKITDCKTFYLMGEKI